MNKDLTIVKCMNCEKVTSFVSSTPSWTKYMLVDKCGACTTVYPNKVLRNNHWWGDGTPVGHEKQLTPEQLKYIVEDKRFKQLIMYREDLVKSAKSLKKYLKRLKPTDEYVRGYKDAREMIDVFMDDVIDVLKAQLYCNDCQEYPAEHTVGLGLDPMNYYEQNEQYIEVCEKCYKKNYKKRGENGQT